LQLPSAILQNDNRKTGMSNDKAQIIYTLTD
jgi:spore germination protein GerM